MRNGTMRLGLLALLATVTTVSIPSGVSAQACPFSSHQDPPHENNVYRRYHAASCWVETDFMQDYVMFASGVANVSSGVGSRRRDMYCPIINDELLSLDESNAYTQIVLSASDALSNNDDSIIVASHCIADPFSMMTECDEQVFTGDGCWGNVGNWINTGEPDIYRCVNTAFGLYALNVPVTVREGRGDFYSYIGISLSKEGTTRVTGYEVSACWFGATCEEIGCGS